jgi:anti-anti-sigma factor
MTTPTDKHTQIDLDREVLTLRVPGDLISTNAETCRNDLAQRVEAIEAAGQEWKIFVADLTAANMVDSVGLNLIVSWIKWVRERGGLMRVAYSSGNVLRTFKFTRLDKHVELVERGAGQSRV